MRILPLIAVCAFVSSVSAQEAPEVLKKLEAVVQAEITKNPHAGAEFNDRPMQGAQSIILRLRSAVRDGNESAQINGLLDELTIIFPTEAVKQAAVKVADDVRKDREQKQKARLSEIDAACQAAVDALHKASDPADLDGVIGQLSRYRNPSSNVSEMERSAMSRAQAALRFLQEWQVFIAAEKSGNAEKARNTLNNMLSNFEVAGLIPRSQLLARLQKYPSASEQKAEEAKPEEIDRVVAQAKTLDEIANVIRQLRAMHARTRPPMYSNSDPVNATLNTLVSIERTYREFQAGLPTKFELTSPQPGDATSPNVTPLKVQLLMLVIPRYLNLPSDLSAKSGETVNQFLERIMDEARRRGDPGLLGRTRDVQRSLMTGTYYMDTTTGTNAFVAGQNQEKAGQFMLAVMSYQNALRSGGDAMPVKLIGQRLSALKTEHPQEYDEGMTHFLAPVSRPWEQPALPPTPRNGPSAVISIPVPGRAGSVAPTASPVPSASPASP